MKKHIFKTTNATQVYAIKVLAFKFPSQHFNILRRRVLND